MKRRIVFRLWVSLFLCLILIGSWAIYFKRNVTPVIVNMTRSTVQNYCVDAINSAAHMVIDEKLSYEEMVNIIRDSDQNISVIQANTVKVNRLARDLANLCQSNIDMIKEQYVTIPLGAFTGSILLSGLGPDVPIKLLPIGSVNCEFKSVFMSVGINQTRHSLYINVDTIINIVLPILTLPIEISTAILVCENIIIGKVPEVYIGDNDTNTDYLDLVPGR